MNENITVNLENLSKNERQTLIKLIEKANKPKENNKIFVPGEGTMYYYLKSQGSAYLDRYVNHEVDSERQAIGNCFETEEEALAMVEKLKIHRELQLFAAEHNECEIDWSNLRQNKYYILKEHDKLIAKFNYWEKIANTVYFDLREIAEKAIEHIGEKRLLKYYFA